jgi:drug/metabolite transporter (DMT)-like permease
MHQKTPPKLIFLALLLVLYWPLSYPLTKVGLRYFSPEGFCALRCTLAAIIMVFYALLRKFPLPAREDIPRILLCGVLGVSGFIYFICIASKSNLSAGTVSFLVAVNPLYVLVYSWITKKEPFTRHALLGSLICVAGVGMLTIYRSGMQVEIHSLYALLSGACFAAYLVLQKPLVTRYHMERLGTYTSIAGGVALLPLAIMHSGELANAPFWPADAVMLFMAIASTCIAFIIWAYLMTHLSQIQTASVGYMLPFSASVSSIFILGEMLPLSSWFGGGLILLGMLAINWHRFRPVAPSCTAC